MRDIQIRDLTSEDDYRMCLDLQQLTWGPRFTELVSSGILKIAQKIGGIASGAFVDPAEMAGFVFGLSGVRDGRLIHWSHMLAVRPGYRDMGIGRKLKQYQFHRVRTLGADRMFWTFDPLVARNAHFNFNVLGASAVEYTVNMYGNDPESTMDAVIGTDRFVVVKELDTPEQTAAGEIPDSQRARPVNVDPETGEPVTAGDLPDEREVSIAVPSDIHELKSRDPELARVWRESTRRSFLHYLNRSYTVSRFSPGPAGGEFVLVKGGTS